MEEFAVGMKKKVFTVPVADDGDAGVDVPETPATMVSADNSTITDFADVGRSPGFTVVDVDTEAIRGFTREYSPSFNTVD